MTKSQILWVDDRNQLYISSTYALETMFTARFPINFDWLMRNNYSVHRVIRYWDEHTLVCTWEYIGLQTVNFCQGKADKVSEYTLWTFISTFFFPMDTAMLTPADMWDVRSEDTRQEKGKKKKIKNDIFDTHRSHVPSVLVNTRRLR